MTLRIGSPVSSLSSLSPSPPPSIVATAPSSSKGKEKQRASAAAIEEEVDELLEDTDLFSGELKGASASDSDSVTEPKIDASSESSTPILSGLKNDGNKLVDVSPLMHSEPDEPLSRKRQRRDGSSQPVASSSKIQSSPQKQLSEDKHGNANPYALSSFTCPICFMPPSNASALPCGHIFCGECLFTAVKSGIRRAGMMGMGRGPDGGAKCPVCRAHILGWDGKGAGVVGLQIRTLLTL